MSQSPVDGKGGPQEAPQTSEEYVQESDYDFDKNYDNTKSSTSKPANSTSTAYSSSTKAQTGPGKTGVATSGELGQPATEQAIANYVQNLKKQGLSKEQIQKMVAEEFGYQPTSMEMDFYLDGYANRDVRMGSKYMGYGQTTVAKYYGSNQGYMDQYFQQQQADEAKQMMRDMKKQGHQQTLKMHKILLLIMMGDIVGALRAYTTLMDKDLRKFTRQVIKKLGKVRKTRARMIRNFATHRFAKAYSGDNPQAAARAQDAAQRDNQFVQLTTQAWSEVQNTERDLMDFMQTIKRDMDNHFQAYASIRDNEFRTTERVMTVR